MYRIMSVFASLVTTSLSLTLIRAQEPPPAQTHAQTKGESKAKPADQSSPAAAKTGEPAKEKKETSKGSTDEEPVITHHTVRVGGRDLKYTATAGLMPIRDAKGDVEARIFFMAYTLDDAEAGGVAAVACSASTAGPARRRSGCTWERWARDGSRRPAEPTIPAPPFRLVDNDATWLDSADLVFIDPVGTGFSRAAKPELNSKFHSLHGDIESVGEFIRMYLTRY